MHTHDIRVGTILTALCSCAMVVLFLSQASVEIQKDDHSAFSILFRNIAYGYHNSSNLCVGDAHTPNGTVSGSEQCDDGNTSNLDSCLNTCYSARCGDGFVNANAESCEPPGLGTCSSSCAESTSVGGSSTTTRPSVSEPVRRLAPPPHCGNGVLEPEKGEECDLGSFRNRLSPECDAFCGSRRCGDGFVHPESEECEPDRAEDGSFIVRTCGGKSCTIPECGEDGTCVSGCHWVFLPLCRNQPLESQSSSKSVSSASSSSVEGSAVSEASSSSSSESSFFSSSDASEARTADVLLPIDIVEHIEPGCGNGVRENGEECDEGAGNSDAEPDGCRTSCRRSFCGDYVIDASYGEKCDDGNDIVGDGCTPFCTLSTCGNGVLESGEECDEGARNNDYFPDACSTLCLLPRCGDGVVDPSFGEECDANQYNSGTIGDACRLNCLMPRCGDGTVDSLEECDDGNRDDADGCSQRCSRPTCGNSIVEKGETCDDGNDVSGDGCDNMCTSGLWSLLRWLWSIISAPFRS